MSSDVRCLRIHIYIYIYILGCSVHTNTLFWLEVGPNRSFFLIDLDKHDYKLIEAHYTAHIERGPAAEL